VLEILAHALPRLRLVGLAPERAQHVAGQRLSEDAGARAEHGDDAQAQVVHRPVVLWLALEWIRKGKNTELATTTMTTLRSSAVARSPEQ
jgi:hypothetical protein